MKLRYLLLVILLAFSLTTDCYAKGSFSSGRSSFSSGGRSFSSSRSYSSPSRSYSGGYRSYSSHTTISRNYYGGGSGYYYHPYGMMGGFGMGYGYSNGLIEGLIIGNLMHPAGTVPYTYGGYAGDALLYPNGMVVNGQGYQVGTYLNGQYTSVQNGGMVAQNAPANPGVAPSQTAQPVIITNNGFGVGDYIMFGILILILLFFFVWLLTVDLKDSISTVTTIYSDEPRMPHPKGRLKRKKDKETGQYYVIDPADKTKTYVNEKDDMYEDAADDIWELE